MREIIHIPNEATIGEKYDTAMKITDPEEAKQYFEACVLHNMLVSDNSREKAIEIEKANLGYYAGYYNDETRARVEKLFDSTHPFFGPISKGKPTPQEAFDTGKKLASNRPLKDFETMEIKNERDKV